MIRNRFLIQDFMKSSRFLSSIATPIFYANSDPHIGHLYTCVLADAGKRWGNLKSVTSSANFKLFTGTDEHGIKVYQAASANNLGPKEHCDMIAATFKNLCFEGDISFDKFIRTTDPSHEHTVHQVWKRLSEGGYIYKGTHSGWYSVSEEAFFPQNQVMKDHDDFGNPIMVCKDSQRPVEWVEEVNFKFRLSNFQERLLDWLERNPGVIYPNHRYKEIYNWLENTKLEDLSISRPLERQAWGIQVQSNPEHSVYVWLDALVNYLSATEYAKSWNTSGIEFGFPTYAHVIGKDILRFHAVYWPAILMALDLPLPKKIIAHGHWTMEGMKMSKSLKNVVKPSELIDRYGIDALRFFLMRESQIQYDCDFSENLIKMRYQVELADQLGNLLSRCLSKSLNPNRAMPSLFPEFLREGERKLIQQTNDLKNEVARNYDLFEFGKGLDSIFQLIRQVNQYLAKEEPWKIIKLKNLSSEQSIQVSNILHVALQSLRVSAILMLPVMPNKSSQILDIMNVPSEHRTLEAAQIEAHNADLYHHFKKDKIILFPRLPKKID